MADPLSITASIVGIVSLGFQVAKGLYQLADGIGSAEEEVRVYAGEINEFSKLLNHIRVTILATPNVPFDSRSLINDVIDICDKVLRPFHRLQNTLLSFLTRFKQSPKKLKQFALRIKWVFCDKSKLLFYLDALRSQHRILNTALDLANLQTTTDRTPQNICILQMSLDNSMAAISLSPNSNSGGSVLSISGTNEQQSIDFHISTSQSRLFSAPSLSQISINSDVAEPSPQIENGLHPRTGTDLVVSGSGSKDHEEQLTAHEIQILEQQIDQDVDPDSGATAVEIWEDTRSISRKAKRLASEALGSRETQVAASFEGFSNLTHKDYTVAWVCTRPFEYAAAVGMLDEHHPTLPQVESDSNTYTLGRIIKHNVILLCVPAGTMDTGVASTAISAMLRSFPNIKIRLLVGVGGGVPSLHSDIRLGDVVVGWPVSSLGGVILLNSSDDNIVEMGTLETQPRELGNVFSKLQARHLRTDTMIPRFIHKMLEANPSMRSSFSAPDSEGDLLFQSTYEHVDEPNPILGCPSCDRSKLVLRQAHRGEISIHYGEIGWTSYVIKSGLVRDAIYSKSFIYSTEKEAMGLINLFPCVVIRGIWNYSDSHANRVWQHYAAATAAGYAKELLETVQPPQT